LWLAGFWRSHRLVAFVLAALIVVAVGADLTRAFLMSADLTEASLRKAKLTNAHLNFA
jgi:uncharacterized protein YjbI with pentapeptide repeats